MSLQLEIDKVNLWMPCLRIPSNALCLGILRLVLAGKIGDAIADTQRLYPGLLDSDPKLLFLLKCRQFIEMVSGVDVSESNSQVISNLKMRAK